MTCPVFGVHYSRVALLAEYERAELHHHCTTL
jgi:hypothetical protein